MPGMDLFELFIVQRHFEDQVPFFSTDLRTLFKAKQAPSGRIDICCFHGVAKTNRQVFLLSRTKETEKGGWFAFIPPKHKGFSKDLFQVKKLIL